MEHDKAEQIWRVVRNKRIALATALQEAGDIVDGLDLAIRRAVLLDVIALVDEWPTSSDDAARILMELRQRFEGLWRATK